MSVIGSPIIAVRPGVPAIDTTLSIAGATADAKAVGDALAKKVDVGGTATELTAGSAEQLLSSTGVEDAVPYSFRQTCGGAEGVGTRVDEEIVGGTICWNQRCVNTNLAGGSTEPVDDAKSYNSNTDTTTFSGTVGSAKYGYIAAMKVQGTIGNIYLISATVEIESDQPAKVWMKADGNSLTPPAVDYTGKKVYSFIQPCNPATGYSGSNILGFSCAAGTSFTVNYSKLNIFDLTAMFGTAVADQILALETATPGAGVALFRSMFPADYYAYNAGELMSVNAARKETVGFNLFDISKAESGKSIAPNGTVVGGSTVVSDFIPVIPGVTYYGMGLVSANAGRTLFTYDSGKNPIKEMYVTPYSAGATAGSFTFDQGVAYVRLALRDAGIACFNISDTTKNGTYEPYQKHTCPLDSSLTLRGIPKLDSNGKLYYDGDIYKADGTVTRRYGVVDLGTLDWAYDGDEIFRYALPEAKFIGLGICSKYQVIHVPTWSQIGDKQMSVTNSPDNPLLRIHDSSMGTDAAAFKAAMSGVYLVYELRTLTTETAEPYQQIQVVDSLGTEEYVDAAVLAGTRDVAVPVGHNSLYMTDLRKKIEDIPGDFSTLLAPIETGYTASKAYAVNDFLIVNSQLYKVTASIANGATITPGTNVTATTVAEVLSALLNS